jgi:hypothetical protein
VSGYGFFGALNEGSELKPQLELRATTAKKQARHRPPTTHPAIRKTLAGVRFLNFSQQGLLYPDWKFGSMVFMRVTPLYLAFII